MKKALLIFLLVSVMILAGCSKKKPLFLNEQFFIDSNELATEINLTEPQLDLITSNTIEVFTEVKDGYLVVHYEIDRTQKYITYFKGEDIEWSLGPYRYIGDPEFMNEEEFSVMYCYALRDCRTAVFNLEGLEQATVNAIQHELRMTSDGGYIVAEVVDNYGLSHIHTYDLIKMTSDYQRIFIKQFVDMVYVNVEKLNDGSFLIQTRDGSDNYRYLRVSEDAEIIYDSYLPLRADIDLLEDGLLISDGLNESIYRVDGDNKEIWRFAYDHYQVVVREEKEDSVIIFVRNIDKESYLEVFDDGTYQELENYQYLYLHPVYKEYDNGDRLGIFRDEVYYLALVDKDDEVIWKTNSYESINSGILGGEYCYLNVEIDGDSYFVKIDDEGREVTLNETVGYISEMTSDGGFIGISSGTFFSSSSKIVKYDKNMKIEWESSQSYIHIDGVLETVDGNFIISYPEHYDIIDPGFGVTNHFNDLFTSEGRLIYSYRDEYISSSYLYSNQDYIYLHANRETTGRIIVKINTAGDIVSEEVVLFQQSTQEINEYYILQDGKLIRFSFPRG